MNDKLEREELWKIFDELNEDELNEELNEKELEQSIDHANEGDVFPSIANDESMEAEVFGYSDEEDIPDVKPNWGGMFWGVVLLSALFGLLVTTYLNGQEQTAIAQLRDNAFEIELDVKDVSLHSLLAFNGEQGSFDQLRELQRQVNANVDALEQADSLGVTFDLPSVAITELRNIRDTWDVLGAHIGLLTGNRNVIKNTQEQVKAVNDLTPQLLEQTDALVGKLIESEASLKLINVGSRQRFLSQRIKASANEVAMGASGWQEAAALFEDDVKLFGEVNRDIRSMTGIAVAPDISRVDETYGVLEASAERIIGDISDYETIRTSVAEIGEQASTMVQQVRQFSDQLDQSENQPVWLQWLPWMLGTLTAMGLIGLIWSLVSYNRKREAVNNLRTMRAEDAIVKLLDEMGDLAQGDLTVEAQVTNEATGAIADSVNFAVGEMRILVSGIKSASNEMANTTEDSEKLIAQLLTSSDAQSEEILSAVEHIENMSNTMSEMSSSALQSSERAKVTADAAKKGAAAVRDTISGMNATRNQIQDTAKRLKQLGESSQQINEIVSLIQDVTEQTNVLSLNASIQAAMAGEAGRGFAVVAEEVQRLADRSGRASSEITELVKNIQSDANNAITSMETTTQEVITGATLADQAGQSLDEIERISQDLYEAIERVASEATSESTVAQTVAERMNILKQATEQGDHNVSQVAIALGQMRDVVEQLDKSVAGFRLPA